MKALLLTAGGLGLLGRGSGTWGSLPPPLIALGLTRLLAADGLTAGERWLIDAALVALLVLFSAVTLTGGAFAEQRWGRKDPGEVVADEVAGQSLTLLVLPWTGALGHDALLALIAFAAFRVFDIWKPPPVRRWERLPSGTGILVDDLIAGVYAVVVVQVVARVVM